jgi:hypothetical protein
VVIEFGEAGIEERTSAVLVLWVEECERVRVGDDVMRAVRRENGEALDPVFPTGIVGVILGFGEVEGEGIDGADIVRS